MRTTLQKIEEAGFTLVELMVVVAIIGVLSAIAVPNFKKYQAKSKTAEAKLQLSAAYTGEQSFYSDYDTYHICLAYMGFNPTNEASQRIYTIGFGVNGTAALNTIATNNGADSTGCSTTGAAGASWFIGAKSLGGTAQTATLTGVTTGIAEDTFIIGAAGVIDDSFTGTSSNSAFTINQSKKITQIRAGY